MALEISEQFLLQLIQKIEKNAHHRPRPETEETPHLDNSDNQDHSSDLTIDDLDQALDRLSVEVADLTQEIREPQKVQIETREQDTSEEETDKNDKGTDQKEGPETDLECPQCGETGFQKIRKLHEHNNSEEDHIKPTKFFKGSDGQYYCFECGETHNSRQGLVTHCLQEHDTKLIDYYLENFEDLKEGRVDGIYDYDGNVPELRKEKKVSDCSRDELRRIIPDHWKTLTTHRTLIR